MHFPRPKGDGRPWIGLDAQAGVFRISTPEGEQEVIDAKNLKFGLDLHNAQQGWLALGKGFRDWLPLSAEDEWGEPPSTEHRPGIELDLICRDKVFGDAQVRVFNGASLAVTNFIGAVAEAVNGNLDDAEAIPTIRIKDIKKRIIGKGSSVTIDFDVAPPDKWMRRKDVMPDAAETPTTDAATKSAVSPPTTTEDDDENWDD